MLHDIKAAGRFGKQGRRPAQNLTRFDYGAPAELFPSRSKAGKSRARYMRFDSAAEALRFVIEKMPALEVAGQGAFGQSVLLSGKYSPNKVADRLAHSVVQARERLGIMR